MVVQCSDRSDGVCVIVGYCGEGGWWLVVGRLNRWMSDELRVDGKEELVPADSAVQCRQRVRYYPITLPYTPANHASPRRY